MICQARTHAEVDAALDAGADVLVVQGTEAGGHTGTSGLLPFLAAVLRRRPQVPVLAAGGIADGRSLAAVLAAGADGAWLGTAFLASPEAREVDPGYKDLIVASDGTDTVLTSVYDVASGLPWPAGVVDRVRANRFVEHWTGREDDLAQRREDEEVTAALDSARFDPASSAVRFGQGAGAVDSVRPVAEIVHAVSTEAERILRDRSHEILR